MPRTWLYCPGKRRLVKKHHNDLSTAVLMCEEKSIKQLIAILKGFTYPFTKESNDLFNLVTKVVFFDKVKGDLCVQSLIGRKLLETF